MAVGLLPSDVILKTHASFTLTGHAKSQAAKAFAGSSHKMVSAKQVD
jgi:hypothetical protein